MNELYHHGILGQKWGERNGPPYPLDSDDHSAEEKRKNHFSKDSSKDSSSNKSNKPKNGLTKGQKTAIKVGVGVAATAIAAYGAYRLVKSGKIGKLIEKGKKILNGQDLEDLKDVTGEYKLRSPLQEASLVNPHFNDTPGYQNNCVLSSIAYTLRREGYKVQPGKSLIGYTDDEILQMYENFPKGSAMKVKDLGVPLEKLNLNPVDMKLRFGRAKIYQDAWQRRGEKVVKGIEDKIKAFYKPGDRGIFTLDTLYGAHAMSWEINPKGKVILLNPQDQKLFTNNQERKFLNKWFGSQINSYFIAPHKTKELSSLIIKTNDLKLSEWGKSLLETESGRGVNESLASIAGDALKSKPVSVYGSIGLGAAINYTKAKKKETKRIEEDKKKKEDKK